MCDTPRIRHRRPLQHGGRAVLVATCLAATAVPAGADANIFFGIIDAKATRPTVGMSWGRAPGLFGFELEYAYGPGKASPADPTLSTVGLNVIVQSPAPVHGVRLYGTVGVGVYGESRGGGSGATDISRSVGAGGKIPIRGGLNLRLDYRVFMLRPSRDAMPTSRHAHRLSAGLCLEY